MIPPDQDASLSYRENGAKNKIWALTVPGAIDGTVKCSEIIPDTDWDDVLQVLYIYYLLEISKTRD